MPLIAMETLVSIYYREDTDKGKKIKMEGVREGFISMKGKLDLKKKKNLGKRWPKNIF